MTYLIMGKTGTGKSYFAAHLIDQLVKGRKLVAISAHEEDIETLDSICEFNALKYYEIHSKNYDKLNYSELISSNQHVAFVFINLTDEEQNAVIDSICEAVFNEGNTVLYIDEAHVFFPQNNYPLELERLIRGGRKRGVDVVLVTQQVIDLRKTALKQAHVGIFFRITEENELKKLRAMSIDADVVSNLPLYKCYVYDFITGEGGITSAEEL